MSYGFIFNKFHISHPAPSKTADFPEANLSVFCLKQVVRTHRATVPSANSEKG